MRSGAAKSYRGVMLMTGMIHVREYPRGMLSSGVFVTIIGLAGLHRHHTGVIVAETTMDLHVTGITMMAASVAEVGRDLLRMADGTAAGTGREA